MGLIHLQNPCVNKCCHELKRVVCHQGIIKKEKSYQDIKIVYYTYGNSHALYIFQMLRGLIQANFDFAIPILGTLIYMLPT